MTDIDDYEAALLGAVLSGYKNIPDLARMLTADDFRQPNHGAIWSAILRVYNAGGQPDPLTVRSALGEWQNKLPGGPAYLTDLYASSGPSVTHYANQIRDSATRRRLRDLALSIDQLANQDTDPDTLIQDAASRLEALREDRPGTSAHMIGQILPQIVDIAQHGREQGLSTPWPDLDRYLRGLHGGRLYVVGARPGIGKSLFGQACATHFALRHNLAAYVASLEMGEDEYTQRTAAAVGRVDLGKLDTGGLDERDWTNLSTAVQKLTDAPIIINDDPGQTLADIRAGAREAARRQQLGLIVVDYLQLVRPTDRRMPREQQVAELSRGFKRLARELRVPVVALAQTNRASTARADARPTLSDLRESGAIEADADAVILLHTDTDLPQIVEALVPKNRSGPKGHAELLIFGHYARLESQSQEPA